MLAECTDGVYLSVPFWHFQNRAKLEFGLWQYVIFYDKSEYFISNRAYGIYLNLPVYCVYRVYDSLVRHSPGDVGRA